MWADLADLASAEQQLEVAQDYYRQAEELYGENENFYEQAAAFYEQGAVAWRQGNYEQVRVYWQRSVEVYGQAYRLKPRIPSERELDQRINILRRSATMALWDDNVTLAVSYYQDILQFYQYMGEPVKQANTLSQIAYLLQLFDSSLSLNTYLMFRPLGGQSLIGNLPERVAVLGNQLGTAAIEAFDQSDYPLAKEYYQGILRLHRESGYLSSGRQLEAHNNLGVIEREWGNYAGARSDFVKAFELAIYTGNVEAASVALLNLSITADLEQDQEMVEAYLARIMQMSEETGIEILPDVQEAIDKLWVVE